MKLSHTSPGTWHLAVLHLFLESQRGIWRYYHACKRASFFNMDHSYIFPKRKNLKCRISHRLLNTLDSEQNPAWAAYWVQDELFIFRTDSCMAMLPPPPEAGGRFGKFLLGDDLAPVTPTPRGCFHSCGCPGELWPSWWAPCTLARKHQFPRGPEPGLCLPSPVRMLQVTAATSVHVARNFSKRGCSACGTDHHQGNSRALVRSQARPSQVTAQRFPPLSSQEPPKSTQHPTGCWDSQHRSPPTCVVGPPACRPSVP